MTYDNLKATSNMDDLPFGLSSWSVKQKKKQKTGITNAKFSFIHSRMMQFIINQKLNHIWGIWILQHKGLSRQNYIGDPKKKEVKKNRGDTNNYNSFGNIAPPIKVFKLKVVTPLW